MLTTELEFFKQHLSTWLETSAGRVALIKDRKLLGFFDNESDALAEGARQFGLQSFLVRRILTEQPEAHAPALTLGILRANSHRST